MRRAAALGASALVAATALATLGGTAAPALSTPAPQPGCEWHRHTKRVVRHVRRHGRRRTVTRQRRWWTCDPNPPTPAAQPQPGGDTPQEAPPQEETPTPPTVSHVGVKAVEWSYTLSRPEVPPGEVVFELNNQGEDNHNMKIVREGGGEPPLAVEETAPGHQTSARFTLPPGTYRLYCSLFEHDEKGMHATLVVGG